SSIPRPPRSTPFPYTTLFRSFFDEIVGLIDRIVAEHIHGKSAGLVHQGLADATGADDGENLAGDLVAQKWQKWMPCAPAIFADLDRKSTRLNSSHLGISYAVF